jgi:ADP-ribosyl-[dinitrogen reductase] hydrolase
MMTHPEKIADRALGSLVGLAVGDALGTTFEGGDRRPSHMPLRMVGGGPHHLEPGQWTDDTAMALCLADSMIATRGQVKHRDLMRRFAKWMEEGHNSCTGTAFDVGWTTRGSISEYVETGNPITGPTGRDGAGNGGIMRLAPAVLANLDDEDRAIDASMEQGRTTHGAPQCTMAAEFQGRLLWRLINRPADMTPKLVAASARHGTPEIAKIIEAARGSRTREDVRASGYVLNTLEAALWAFSRSDSFQETLVQAINLGDDADTVGAVAGQIAGAAYGLSSIPHEWLKDLAWKDEIVERAEKLVAISNAPRSRSLLHRLLGRT